MTQEDMTPAGKRLKSFLERIETINTQRQELADDIKEIKAEAKGEGFDVPTINTLLKIRKKSPDELAEEEALLDSYLTALRIK